MHSSLRVAPLLIAVALGCAAPAAETTDSAAPAAAPSLTADLLTDVSQVEQKVIGLAQAIPADKYAWKPSADVRTVAQVFKHIAADNYLMPAALGNTPDSSTGIKGDDYQTAVAYEGRDLSRDQIIAELQASFAFVKNSLQSAPAAQLGTTATLFGREFTGQQVWLMTATHLHEHLGQMIAYARSIGVKPPWAN